MISNSNTCGELYPKISKRRSGILKAYCFEKKGVQHPQNQNICKKIRWCTWKPRYSSLPLPQALPLLPAWSTWASAYKASTTSLQRFLLFFSWVFSWFFPFSFWFDFYIFTKWFYSFILYFALNALFGFGHLYRTVKGEGIVCCVTVCRAVTICLEICSVSLK